MKRQVTFFRRSRAEKESDVNDSSTHPENNSRDDTDRQRPPRVYRKTGFTFPKELHEFRRKRYRKRPEDGDDEGDSESDGGDIDDRDRYDQRRSYHNRDRRNGSRHYNGNDNNRKSHRRTSNLRHTHRDDDNNSSVRECSPTIRTYKTKVHKERKLQDNDEKRTKKYKGKLQERLISDTTLEEFPTRDNREHTPKEITFSIVRYTKSATSIDSDIVFIPVVVYPKENRQNKERSETSSNYHEETQINPITEYENEFVHAKTKDFGSIYQQEPNSLDNNKNVSTDDGCKRMSTPTYSIGNEVVTKDERQPCLKTNDTLIYTAATLGNIFQNQEASVHDVVSQKNEKLDEKSLLGVKNENTKNTRLFIDKDNNSITSAKCLSMDESVSPLSGNINPILKEPLILDCKIETKPLYSSEYLDEKLTVPALTEPIDKNHTSNTNEKLKVPALTEPTDKNHTSNTNEKLKVPALTEPIDKNHTSNTNEKLKVPALTEPIDKNQTSNTNEKLKVPALTEPIDKNQTSNTNLEEISKLSTLDRKCEINFKRKPTDMQMKKRNTKEPTMVNKGDEDNNLRLNKKIQMKEKGECVKDNFQKGKNNYIPLTDTKENLILLEDISKNYKNKKTVSKCVHIYRAMHDDYDKTKDVFKQRKLKDKIYGVNRTTKVFGNTTQNETKIPTNNIYKVQEGYRSYTVSDTKWDKTTSSKYFLSGPKKEDYKTLRPGFVTTLNCSGDPPIQKLNPMTYITKTEKREGKKEDVEKSNGSEKLVDKSSPDGNKTIEENEDEGIARMVGRYLMEGCHILLGISVHSVVMDVINGFGVVNRKVQKKLLKYNKQKRKVCGQ